MSTLTTKAVAKVAAVATGLGMATSLLSLAPMAHAAALTSTQISSIISLLQSFGADATTVANVQASLSGGTPSMGTTTSSMSSSCSFTMDLHMGSSGAQVTCLQNALVAAGYSLPAGATGYFGSQTKAAVMKWQMKAGVTPALGYFGALSRAAWGVSSNNNNNNNGTSTNPTTLTGSGRFTQESTLGDVTTSLHAGDPVTAVVGDSFVATGGDVQLQRVDATFDLSGVTTGSTHLDQYVSDVEVWLGNTKLASMDASAGSVSSQVWTYRFSGLNQVVTKGNMAKIYIKVTPLASVANKQDANGSWAGTMKAQLLANAVRAIGGDGISDTYVANAVTQNFTVASANTATLSAGPSSDNPVATTVSVSSSTTSGVKLLGFTLKAKNAGANINNLKISLNTSATNLSDVINTVYLMKGSTVMKSATLSTGSNGTVTFQNLNESIAKDTTNTYYITADFKGDSAYADGTTVIASTTTSGWDVSDTNGNTITPSAAVAGNTMTLTGTGISAVLGTPTATVNTASFAGGKDTASYTIPFTVTAADTAVWVGGGTPTATTTTAGRTATSGFASALNVVYATTTTSTATSTTVTASLSSGKTDTNDANGNYYVASNSSRTFTLNLTTAIGANSAGTSIELGYQLVGVNYSNTSTMGSTYYTSNLTSFKSPDAFLYAH